MSDGEPNKSKHLLIYDLKQTPARAATTSQRVETQTVARTLYLSVSLSLSVFLDTTPAEFCVHET